MSGITDTAATQAHDIVEQAEAQEQKVSRCPMFAPRAACITLLTNQHEKVQGDKAMTGEGVGAEGSNTASTGDQHAAGENKSKLDKVKEALHLKK
jgi:hypothetical protein